MKAEMDKMEFTPTQHAMLFAWISRELIREFGEEDAAPLIRSAVRKYGNQRGGRMALRTAADSRPLDMFNYLVYGEWEAPQGEMQMEYTALAPDLKANVYKCPWSTAWKENGLIEYGKYYCMEVDEALVEGYNPGLTLEVAQTMTNGAEFCDFSFNEANLTPEKAQLMAERSAEVSQKTIMSWEYHIAHLLKTMNQMAAEKFGTAGEKAVQKAINIFKEHYGNKALNTIQDQLTQDFDQLPQ